MIENMKKKRKILKLTQREVANYLKITIRNYQRIEAGTQTPRLKTALNLAKVLNTTVEELFEDNKIIKQNKAK